MTLFVRRRDTEALLSGEPLDDDSALNDVAAFLAEMRLEFGAMPAPEPRPTLASTLDGRRELRPESGPAPKPTFPPARPKSHRMRPAAVVFATGAVLFGGLASAGALPGPAQRATARFGSELGIHLPGETTTPTPKARVGPATTKENDGTDRPTSTSGPATSSTTVPGTSPTTAPAPGSSVLPTPPTIPGVDTGSGVVPTVPTTTKPPTLEAPQLPTSGNPLQDLIDRITGSLGLPIP
jgi:hypothetical protein